MSNSGAGLERFTAAQAGDYDRALAEIRAGRKRSHWMWYVFPQLRGLGRSEMAHRYGIADAEEARAYLDHALLGARLREISSALLEQPERDPTRVMGSPDDMKLRSSMTLFEAVARHEEGQVFTKVIEAFYRGQRDESTLRLLKSGD